MKNKIMIIILFFCIFSVLCGIEGEQPKLNMLIFLSENCEICEDFLIQILPALENKHHLEYTIYYDYEDNAKYLLTEIENEFGKMEKFPIVLMGNELIKGDEIYSKLEATIEEYSSLGGCCVPLLYEFEQKEEESNKFPVYIAYVYGNDVAEFKKTNNDLEELTENYPLLTIKKFNIETIEGKRINDSLCKTYHIADKDYNKTPKMFVGDDLLIESQVNFDSIKMLIIRYKENEEISPWEKILDENKGE